VEVSYCAGAKRSLPTIGFVSRRPKPDQVCLSNFIGAARLLLDPLAAGPRDDVALALGPILDIFAFSWDRSAYRLPAPELQTAGAIDAATTKPLTFDVTLVHSFSRCFCEQF
jgi:hypothetical protein